MPTRKVVLTDRQEAFVSELVASGRYRNASEMLRARGEAVTRSGAALLPDEAPPTNLRYLRVGATI